MHVLSVALSSPGGIDASKRAKAPASRATGQNTDNGDDGEEFNEGKCGIPGRDSSDCLRRSRSRPDIGRPPTACQQKDHRFSVAKTKDSLRYLPL
jgi:hypothetical protein